MSISKLLDYIKHKQKELKEATYYLKKYPELNNRQKELVRHALDNSDAQYTIDGHQSIHSITYETARTDLLSLVDKKLLVKTTKGKTFYFVPSKDLHRKIKHK